MFRYILFSFCLVFICCKSTELIDTTSATEVPEVETIAFGSCNHHDDPQPLWKDIISNKADVWIWLGDIVYGDTEDMNAFKAKYDAQKKQVDYQKFLNSECEIIGIWDDHDYGKNNAGKEYAKKAESKDLLFDFLEVSEDSKERLHEGAYSSYVYGPKGKQVKVILLDARYFRDKPDVDGTVLGVTQWDWLAKELHQSDAKINIIGCGIQIIPEEHRFEKWANFPKERNRLFDLIASTKATGVILLSGDRHIAEISKLDWEGINYPIYEITSSGLTHFYNGFTEEANQHRVGEVVANYNFGLINIDWGKEATAISLEIRGLDNVVHQQVQVTY